MLSFAFRRPQLTYKNHFKHGFRPTDSNTYYSQIERPKRKFVSSFIEAQKSAQYIYENRRGLTIQLCLSGGVDSESMLRAFIASGVPFEVYFLKFQNELNLFDIQTNIEFCNHRAIPYKMIDIDILKFFESGDHVGYGTNYKCQSPQIATHLWLLDQLDGLPILGGNPIVPVPIDNQYFYLGMPGMLHCAYFRYFEITKRPSVPWFFMYSPELIASFLESTAALQFKQGQFANEYALKCLLYKQNGFDIAPRADKYTGFERVRSYYDHNDNSDFGQAFDRRFRHPMVNMNPVPDRYLQLVPSEYLGYKPNQGPQPEATL